MGGILGNILGGHQNQNTNTTQNTTGTVNQNTTQQQNQTQQQTGQTTNQGTQTTSPNLPTWYSQFLQSIPQQFGGLSQQLQQQAQTPLYGAQQQATQAQNLNQLYGQAGKDINSQLASRGALNSALAGQTATGLALGKAGQMGNYLAQTPLLNAQNQQAIQQQQLGLMGQQAGFQPTNAFGATTTGSSVQNTLNNLISALSGSSSMNQNSTQNMTGTQKTGGGSGLLGKA
jgi:hypothetical protein